MEEKDRSLKRPIAAILLIAYAALLIKVMVLKDIGLIRIGPLMLNFGGTQEGPANLVPLRTILPYLLGEKGLLIAGINIGGNILFLVPPGMLIPVVLPGLNWKRMIAAAIASGLSIEAMQAVLHVGIFDIDDVILNGLGVLAGYWLVEKLPAAWHSPHSRMFVIGTGAILTAMALFIMADLYKSLYAHDGPPVSPNGDLCHGTGGTGSIVETGNGNITILRRDGEKEIIQLTDQTIVRKAAGPVQRSDLRIGDRVTVVTGASDGNVQTATHILVCGPARVWEN